MYTQFLDYILPVLGTCLGTILTALAGYAVVLIVKKKEEIKSKTECEVTKKYIDMISNTIIDCVIATNQTYVETLKKQNAFTKEAQEEAFNRTFTSVMDILSDDCLDYLATITDDVDAFIKTKIEAEVKRNK